MTVTLSGLYLVQIVVFLGRQDNEKMSMWVRREMRVGVGLRNLGPLVIKQQVKILRQ